MTNGRWPLKRDMAMALAIIAIALLGHAAYIHAVQPDAPYMDSVRMLVFQQAWRDGTMSLFDLWEPAGAHHRLLDPMLLLANVTFFHLDARLATYVTGWVIALTCALVAFDFLADRRTAPPTGRAQRALPYVLAVVVLALLFFSLAGVQLLLMELGLANWVKYLLFVVYFLAHQAWLRKDTPNVATALLLAVFGMAIVLLAGGGWSYGLAAGVIGTQALTWLGGRRDRGAAALLRWVPVVALVLALVIYALLGQMQGGSARAPINASIALLPFYALGSGWIGSVPFRAAGGAEFAFFIAGVVSVLAGAWALWRRWLRGMLSGSLLPVYLLGYSAACAVLFAIARGGWGIEGLTAPRYYMDVAPFVIGMLWLLFEDAVARRDGASRLSGIACIAIAAIVFSGHAWTYRAEWRSAPHRAMALDRLEDAFRRGATTQADARAVLSYQPLAAQAATIMRTRGLAVFRQDDSSRCNADGVRWFDGWYAPGKNHTRWMKQAARIDIPPCGCVATAKAYLPPGFAARNLVVETGDAKRTLALVPGKMTPVTLPASPYLRTATLSVSVVTDPVRDVPGSKDTRILGALFGPVQFACAASAR